MSRGSGKNGSRIPQPKVRKEKLVKFVKVYDFVRRYKESSGGVTPLQRDIASYIGYDETNIAKFLAEMHKRQLIALTHNGQIRLPHEVYFVREYPQYVINSLDIVSDIRVKPTPITIYDADGKEIKVMRYG